MSIRVAVFYDNKSIIGGLSQNLVAMGFGIQQFRSAQDISDYNQQREFDVAIIHLGFQSWEVDTNWIINEFLGKKTRRIITSGHHISDVARDCIERFQADHYLQDLDPAILLGIINLGMVNEEEQKSRGVTVRNADRGAVKLEMGISPDGDNYDDDRYFRKAKKGENR